jgi:hypothetical protein
MLYPVWVRYERWDEPAGELWSAADLLMRRSFTYSYSDSNGYRDGDSHSYGYKYTNTDSYADANANTYTEGYSHAKASPNGAAKAVVEIHCR